LSAIAFVSSRQNESCANDPVKIASPGIEPFETHPSRKFRFSDFGAEATPKLGASSRTDLALRRVPREAANPEANARKSEIKSLAR
jgi:hypothetical protein